MSAGASFQTGIAIGKFHGVMRPTTPSGRRSVYSRWFGDGRLVHLADRPPRLTRRVAEDRRGAQRFQPGLAQRLPHLRRHVLRDLLGARLDRVGRLREEGRALPGRQRGPGGERLARGLDRGTRVLGRPRPDRRPTTSDGRQGLRFSYVSPDALSRHSPPT